MKTGKIIQLKHVKEIPSKDPQKYPNPSHIWKLKMEGGEVGEGWFPDNVPAPKVGDTLTYEWTAPEKEGWSAKITIQREKKGFQKGAGGWSPEKEASVKIQGLLKSIIETTAPKDQWGDLLAHALIVHDMALAAQLAKAKKVSATNGTALAQETTPTGQIPDDDFGDENPF